MKKERAKMRRSTKRYLKKAGILASMVFLTACGAWYLYKMHLDNVKASPNDRDNIVTADGVTQTGMEPVFFEISAPSEIRLCVAEVYLSGGDIIEAGKPCIRFTDDSIEKARAKLERAAQEADLAYRRKVVADGEDKIKAKNTYDTTVLEAGYAPQIYQDTLAQLELQLVRAEHGLEEAQNAYSEYYTSVVNNTFYEDYQVGELKKAYDEAYNLFVSRRTYWKVTQEELDALSNSKNAYTGQDDRTWMIRTVALLKEELTAAQQAYEQAKGAYQAEINGAELKLQQLLNQLEQAQQGLIDAQLASQKGSLHAKTLCELASARGALAANVYDISLMELATELDRLSSARDQAEADRALFEELVGDGCLYTQQAGTVVMVNVAQGQLLSGGEQIYAYHSPGECYVSAAVPQKRAKKLFVGESASVEIPGYGSFNGVVEKLEPVSGANSQTNIYNMAVISLDGDTGGIASDLTAAVTFEGEMYDNAVQCSATGSAQMTPMYDLDFYASAIPAGIGEEGVYLKAAEVYVKAGQHIGENDPVCTFTQESIENVRYALIRCQYMAGKALMEAQTSYHLGVLEAGLTHNEVLLDNTLAQAEYDNTIAKCNSSMVAKFLETEQLLSEIYQMQTALTDESHQKRQAEITRVYDQAKKQLEAAKENFVTNQVEAAGNFQVAKDAYEKFFHALAVEDQQIADKASRVYTLQEEILQDKQLMEQTLLTAGQSLASDQTKGAVAAARYAGIKRQHEEAVNRAQLDLVQASRRLEQFEQFVGDGTVYAVKSGLVTAVGCTKGDLLTDLQELVHFVPDADIDSENKGNMNINDRTDILKEADKKEEP